MALVFATGGRFWFLGAVGGRFWQLRVAIGGRFWRGAGLLPVYVRGHCGLYRLQERASSW